MEFPKMIRIGCVGYAVKETEDLHSVDTAGVKQWLHGHILLADAIIKIASDQADDIKLVTLWHEILHGILNNAGQKQQPEGFIEALSFGLIQLIRDNPELITLTLPMPTGDKLATEGRL